MPTAPHLSSLLHVPLCPATRRRLPSHPRWDRRASNRPQLRSVDHQHRSRPDLALGQEAVRRKTTTASQDPSEHLRRRTVDHRCLDLEGWDSRRTERRSEEDKERAGARARVSSSRRTGGKRTRVGLGSVAGQNLSGLLPPRTLGEGEEEVVGGITNDRERPETGRRVEPSATLLRACPLETSRGGSGRKEVTQGEGQAEDGGRSRGGALTVRPINNHSNNISLVDRPAVRTNKVLPRLECRPTVP